MTLFELFGILRKRLMFIIILSLLGLGIATIYARTLPNQYTTSTTMYVLSKNDAQGDQPEQQVTQSDLYVGQMLTNDVSTIITSTRVKNDVAEQLGLEDLAGYGMSVTSTTNTRVITLSVTGRDPQLAADIANALVADTSEVASEVMQIESVNVIDEAQVPLAPSGPRRTLYSAVGLMAGLFGAICIVVIQDMLDTRIKSGEVVENLVDIPVLGHFPYVER